MNILLTNDDGYDASGITELHKSLSKDHNVYLIAPKENCSGMSAAISLRKEIEVKEISKNIFSVDGTPADCSYLGLLSVIPDSIGMIVSGINLGANLGEDIFYSGTVGAAIAGRRLNYVPVAFSVTAFTPKNLSFISEQASLIVNQVSKLPNDKNIIVNVNFPDLSSSKLNGTKLTMLGKRGTPDTPDLIGSNNSSKFYSFGPSGKLLPNQIDTDIQAIDDNYISISILDYNLSVDASNWNFYREVLIVSSSGFTFTRVKDQMIQELLDMGIKDFRVLDSLSQVPRHIFLDQALWSRAYENRALTIGYKQTISQPYIVARMTEHLIAHTTKRGKVLNNVLEIGSGCGYQSAVLSNFANEVFAVERIKPLVTKSRENLRELKIRNVTVKHANGFDGWEEDSKFDGIICAAAPRQYPEELVELLEVGGKLVIPAGNEGQQKLFVITKKSETENEETIHEEVAFVPMLPGISNGEI